MSDINYHAKYLKYKTKYLQLLNSYNISNNQFAGATGGTGGQAAAASSGPTGACEKNDDCQSGDTTQCRKEKCEKPDAKDVVTDDLANAQPMGATALEEYKKNKSDPGTSGGTGAPAAAGATGGTGSRTKYSINQSFNIDDYLN